MRRADTVDEALRAAAEALVTHARVLVQGHARARQQAGVNLLVVDGEPVLESMMLSLHDNPHTGGTSGLRRSWWYDAMRDDALARVRHLGWSGVAMLEYKWDPASGAFEFIEINSRFWAALHLDLYAGADFPRRLLECHLAGEPRPARRGGAAGLTSRWTLPMDWGHMLSKLRDPALTPAARCGALLAFGALLLHPGVRDDLRFPGDSGLYYRQWRRFLAESLGLSTLSAASQRASGPRGCARYARCGPIASEAMISSQGRNPIVTLGARGVDVAALDAGEHAVGAEAQERVRYPRASRAGCCIRGRGPPAPCMRCTRRRIAEDSGAPARPP